VAIVVLGTGGTIASTVQADGRRRASLTAQQLLSRVPTLRDRTDLRARDLHTINSWALDTTDMIALAERVRTELEPPDVDGVVLTHGTDTLEETAWLTDLWLGSSADEGGVVVTGAMRAADELSPDGDRNLDNAVRVAGSALARGRGALVVLDDDIHAAREVTKVATDGIGALRSPMGPCGRVDERSVAFLREPSPRPLPGDRIEPRVAAFAVFPGMDGHVLLDAVARGAVGVALEGTGLGNVPPAVGGAVRELVADNVPVVIAARPRRGATDLRYGGEGGGGTLLDDGAIPAGDLPLHKARVALMVALGRDPSVPAVRAWFDRV
jgi:L-asparaginase